MTSSFLLDYKIWSLVVPWTVGLDNAGHRSCGFDYDLGWPDCGDIEIDPGDSDDLEDFCLEE